jgi:hypothetical protein
MNLVIIDDKSRILYGHQLLKHSMETSKPMEAYAVRGMSAECYILYVGRRFPDCKEVRELVASRGANGDLLEEVSDRIELTEEDAENMMLLERYIGALRSAGLTPTSEFARTKYGSTRRARERDGTSQQTYSSQRENKLVSRPSERR